MKPLKLLFADYRRTIEKYGAFTVPWPELLAYGLLILITGISIGFTLSKVLKP